MKIDVGDSKPKILVFNKTYSTPFTSGDLLVVLLSMTKIKLK